jgi:BolA protein
LTRAAGLIALATAAVLEMRVADMIRRKLTERFAPIRLEIADESHRHAGHEGARPEGETHFSVTIVCAWSGQRARFPRQRWVV